MKSALKVTPKIQADAGVHDPQYLARDFKSSVWVAASAGTGKTKVLIDRVLTLLLEGASPEKILCLTFTKAAAAEMTSRITQRLSAWVIAPTDELKAELETLLGRPVEGDITKRARHLVKEVFGHLKLQTIHSFCQSLLKRFPLESGVSPHFDVLDEGVARLLLEQSEREVLTAPSLKNDIAILTRVMEPGVFKSLMGQIANQRDRFESVVKDGEGAYKTRLNAFLGLMGDETKEGLEKEVLTQFSQSGIYYAKEALGSGSKTDQEKAILLNKWLSVDAENRGSLLGQYESLFFTTKGERRARLCTKGVLNEFPDIEDVLAHEAERLNVLRDRAKALSVATYSEALLKVGQEFLAIYERIKQRRSVLDYNDLIGKSVALLSQKSMTPWVLYKLDGGMDHILIDEAQDTSHSQWQVIGALVEGLLENPGIAPRTMFSVGDEKQSIYSFQGADPQLFKNMRSTFQDRVEQEGQFWKDVDLTVSFRSTEPILQVVDQVFKAPILQQGLGLGQAVSHEVHRTSQAGLVEIWPLAIPIEQESGSAWEVPITRRQADSPRTRLAHRIATQIHGWLESQEILPSQNRPICPGDILILVRRRTEFVEELMRFLKAKGIPVSGLDRMRLLDQLAVMDLMALGEFILLPEDDLNLAVVLKGPLIGLTEEQLFGLCHERSGLSLWAALGQRKGDNPIYGEAHSFLNKLLSMNETLSPYALFATILGKMEGQKKLLSCLGLEASDTIEAFLTHCHTYERRHGLSLQGFLAWFKTSDPEIKRDLDQGGNHVRIMTVHGSKGLQAPIVILPDTTHVPSHPQRLFWPSGEDGGGLMVFSPKKNSDGEVVNDLRSADKSREVHEYFRLLYVAMTRAEDRLYVCGWQVRSQVPENCWYNLVTQGMSTLGDALAKGGFPETGWMGKGRRLESIQPFQRVPIQESSQAVVQVPLPLWIHTMAPKEFSREKIQAPSEMGFESEGGDHAHASDEIRLRGVLIHRLLEKLPLVASDRWESICTRYLEAEGAKLSPECRREMTLEVLGVLRAPELHQVFAGEALTEVPIVGKIKGKMVSGQIDRLVIKDQEIWVVDYKTSGHIPEHSTQVSKNYLTQMEAYNGILRGIYPTCRVRNYLLWTRKPSLMELPSNIY